jgi:hypothetical protein
VWCGRRSVVRAMQRQRTSRASDERARRTLSQSPDRKQWQQQIGSGIGMEVRGRSRQPPRGRATEHHNETCEMRFHGTWWWLTMSGVDRVLESRACTKSGLESEQPGPQPCFAGRASKSYRRAADTPLGLKSVAKQVVGWLELAWARVVQTQGSIDTTSPASCIPSLAEAQEPREHFTGEARALGLTSDKKQHRSR